MIRKRTASLLNQLYLPLIFTLNCLNDVYKVNIGRKKKRYNDNYMKPKT